MKEIKKGKENHLCGIYILGKFKLNYINVQKCIIITVLLLN